MRHKQFNSRTRIFDLKYSQSKPNLPERNNAGLSDSTFLECTFESYLSLKKVNQNKGSMWYGDETLWSWSGGADGGADEASSSSYVLQLYDSSRVHHKI